jgi:hypothetical protein
MYYYFGRCIVTCLEDNVLFNNSAELFGNIILENPKNKDVEEIVINMGNLIIINKIIVLSLIEYYKITVLE